MRRPEIALWSALSGQAPGKPYLRGTRNGNMIFVMIFVSGQLGRDTRG